MAPEEIGIMPQGRIGEIPHKNKVSNRHVPYDVKLPLSVTKHVEYPANSHIAHRLGKVQEQDPLRSPPSLFDKVQQPPKKKGTPVTHTVESTKFVTIPATISRYSIPCEFNITVQKTSGGITQTTDLHSGGLCLRLIVLVRPVWIGYLKLTFQKSLCFGCGYRER